MLELRKSWFDDFREDDTALQSLAKRAPLIERAVQKRIGTINMSAFDDEQTLFRRFLDGELTLKGLRHLAPRIAAAVDDALDRPDERAHPR